MNSIIRAYNKFLFFRIIPLLEKIPGIRITTSSRMLEKFNNIRHHIYIELAWYIICMIYKNPTRANEYRSNINHLIEMGMALERHLDGIAYLSSPGDEPQFRHGVNLELLNSPSTPTYEELEALANPINVIIFTPALMDLYGMINKTIKALRDTSHFTQTPEWQSYNQTELTALELIEKMKQNAPTSD